jgi:hypothetical protein
MYNFLFLIKLFFKMNFNSLFSAPFLSLFFSLFAFSNTAQAQNKTVYKNNIWIDLLSAPAGFASLGYERAITNGISVEANVGLTFRGFIDPVAHTLVMKTFENNAFKSIPAYWAAQGYTDTPDPLLGLPATLTLDVPANLAPSTSIYLSIAPKFFLEGRVFDGFYVAPRLQYINFNYNTPMPLTARTNSAAVPYSTENAIVSKSYLDLMPVIGWQWGDSRVVWSYELGGGVRFVNVRAFDTGFKPVAGGFQHEVRTVDVPTTIPCLSSMLKMGIMF